MYFVWIGDWIFAIDPLFLQINAGWSIQKKGGCHINLIVKKKAVDFLGQHIVDDI